MLWAADGVGCSGACPLTCFPPFSGIRSYPLRGSQSLDDLLDRPGNSTAPSEYWDGQSRSRTPSGVPSRTPSPVPTPLPGSRRGSMGSMGAASDGKVSPSPSPPSPLGWSSGQGDRRPGNLPCLFTEGQDGLPSLGWRMERKPSAGGAWEPCWEHWERPPRGWGGVSTGRCFSGPEAPQV